MKIKYLSELEKKLKEIRYDLEMQKIKVSKYSNEDILKKGYSITRHKGKVLKGKC